MVHINRVCSGYVNCLPNCTICDVSQCVTILFAVSYGSPCGLYNGNLTMINNVTCSVPGRLDREDTGVQLWRLHGDGLGSVRRHLAA